MRLYRNHLDNKKQYVQNMARHKGINQYYLKNIRWQKNGWNVTHLSKFGQLLEVKFKPITISFSKYLNDQITDSFVIKLTNTEEVYQQLKNSLMAKQLVQTASTPQWWKNAPKNHWHQYLFVLHHSRIPIVTENSHTYA